MLDPELSSSRDTFTVWQGGLLICFNRTTGRQDLRRLVIEGDRLRVDNWKPVQGFDVLWHEPGRYWSWTLGTVGQDGWIVPLPR